MFDPNSRWLRLYYGSPIPAQNILFSLAGARNYIQRYNAHYHSYLNFLRDSQWWNSNQIGDYQEQQLKLMIKHAFEKSPYVNNQLRSANLRPEDIRTVNDLQKIPICNKDLLRDSELPYHDQTLPRSSIIKGLTSGTSGRALTLYNSSESIGRQWAVWSRHKERFGIRLRNRHLTFGARVPIDSRQQKPPFWRFNLASNQTYLSTFHLSEKFLPDIVNFIKNQKFDYFIGYPSSMYVLAKYMQEHQISLENPPKYVIGGSEVLLPHFETMFKSVFNAEVTEQYGVGEACGNFSKCENNRFHLDFEFGIVELLEIPNEVKLKRILFTSLANKVMPLVRYDIGDYVEVDDQSCSCGRSSLTVKRVMGRLEDFIVTPDGRFVAGMNQVFEWAPSIREVQITQRSADSITVNYVPGNNFSILDLDSLEIELRKRLGDTIAIVYFKTSEIPRSSSGKYKAVISEMSQARLNYDEATDTKS
ncbi:MAG: hypothetical protein K2U26_17360 [Cyclobacteriaceae bacterium]|nr:hypothetical protein [Cyclobacteriaceae bacterium]